MRSEREKGQERQSIELARALLNETRLALVDSLLQRSQYISDLAKSVNSDRATVCYHLKILERLGVIGSQYVMLQEPRLKGKVGRVYSVNRRQLKQALEAVEQRLPKLGI